MKEIALEKFLHKNVRKSRFLFFFKPGTLNATNSVPSPSKCTKIVGGSGFAQTHSTGEVDSTPPGP